MHSVEILRIQLDDELDFSPHISNICKSAANQLNALIKLQKFLNFEEKKILTNSYFMADFNYCPLVWMFSNAVSLKKIENLQKQALSFLYKSYNTSYEDLLLKSGFSSMNVKRLRTLVSKFSKLLILIQALWKKFILRQTDRSVWEKYGLNLDIPSYNQVTFGRKGLTFFGPKPWNSLPYHIRSAENLASFKTMIKFWNGETCSCEICCKKLIFFPIRLAGNFCSEIQDYQMTHAFVDPEVKLVTRVTTKLLQKSCPITNSNLLNFSFKTVYKYLLFNI